MIDHKINNANLTIIREKCNKNDLKCITRRSPLNDQYQMQIFTSSGMAIIAETAPFDQEREVIAKVRQKLEQQYKEND